ncbi:hypothetical protein Ciccas_001155, partial [Cichlidogyrus casuarinus]
MIKLFFTSLAFVFCLALLVDARPNTPGAEVISRLERTLNLLNNDEFKRETYRELAAINELLGRPR